MRVRMAKGATVLGRVATRLGEAGVDINRLQTHVKDERDVVLDLLLDVPAHQSIEAVLAHCQALAGVRVEGVISYPAGADLHQDLELVQQLDRCTPDAAPEVLAAAAPLLCGGTWALLLQPGDRTVTFRTSRAPALSASDLAALGDLGTTHAVALPPGCPVDVATQLAVVAMAPRGTLVVARTGEDRFSPAELARLDHLAGVAAGSRPVPRLDVPAAHPTG